MISINVKGGSVNKRSILSDCSRLVRRIDICYRLISPIVCRESFYFGETADLIREAAGKIYQISGSRRTMVSTRTIERYLKQYREGCFKALMLKSKSPRLAKIPEEYFKLALDLLKNIINDYAF